jgi:hypothetical protein
MKYMIWNCDEQRLAIKQTFRSQVAAQWVCNMMNGDATEPLYAVVVDMKGVQICF